MEVSGEGREIRRDGGHGRGSRRVAATEDEIDGMHAAKAVSAENTDVNEEKSCSQPQEQVLILLRLPCFLSLSLSLPIIVNGLQKISTSIQKPGWKKFLAHVGPGFLVSLAYLDPGNCKRLSLSL